MYKRGNIDPTTRDHSLMMLSESSKSDVTSQKSSLKASLKETLKRKASKFVKAVISNSKKRKKSNGDDLSLSSVEEPIVVLPRSGLVQFFSIFPEP
jgi:hypothetical protein